MTLRFHAFSLLICASAYAQGQSLRYDIVKGGKLLGEMEAHHYIEDEEEYYHIRSDVSFKLLFSFHVTYEQEEVFINDTLVWGSGSSTLNDAVQKETRLRKRKTDYLLTVDGISNRLNQKAIIYSMSQVHFVEPWDGARFYSQHFGQYVTFDQIGDHQYQMTSPDGENIYTYFNGYCTRIKVVRDYATYEFVMKPETLVRVKNKTDTLFHK